MVGTSSYKPPYKALVQLCRRAQLQKHLEVAAVKSDYTFEKFKDYSVRKASGNGIACIDERAARHLWRLFTGSPVCSKKGYGGISVARGKEVISMAYKQVYAYLEAMDLYQDSMNSNYRNRNCGLRPSMPIPPVFQPPDDAAASLAAAAAPAPAGNTHLMMSMDVTESMAPPASVTTTEAIALPTLLTTTPSTTTEIMGLSTPFTPIDHRDAALSDAIPTPCRVPKYNHRYVLAKRKKMTRMQEELDSAKKTRDDKYQVMRLAEEASDAKLVALRKARDEYFNSASIADVRSRDFMVSDTEYKEVNSRLMYEATYGDDNGINLAGLDLSGSG